VASACAIICDRLLHGAERFPGWQRRYFFPRITATRPVKRYADCRALDKSAIGWPQHVRRGAELVERREIFQRKLFLIESSR
jgi:hypothetical protein